MKKLETETDLLANKDDQQLNQNSSRSSVDTVKRLKRSEGGIAL